VTSANNKNETTEVSAKVPLGSGMYVVAHFEQNKFNGTNATTTADYSQFGALVAKDLSKRTAIFAGYRSLDRTNGTDTKITTGGLQHSF
jgi:predicted porin